MFDHLTALSIKQLIIASAIVLGSTFANALFAQSTNQLPPQQVTAQPPGIPPDLNSRPPRAVQRIGTAIPPPRNSVSIKSTDAGVIPRQSPMSGCINCGVVDFVNKIGQVPNMNAIVSGVVAGTIARGVIGQVPHGPHSGDMHHPHDSHPDGYAMQPSQPYQIGVTMDDGRQAVIAIPDGTNFQQGDRVKWVDGVLVLDRQAVP